MDLATCRCRASARFPLSAEPVNRRTPELQKVVEDFERLWTVAGFAEQFAAHLILPPAPPVPGDVPGDPYTQVLEEHHRRLVAALRRAQQRGEAAPGHDLDDRADALVGFYLSRRLCRRRLDDWALTAIATIIY
jgi:hypothetical protein